MFSDDMGNTFRSISVGDLGIFKQRKDRTRYELKYKF